MALSIGMQVKIFLILVKLKCNNLVCCSDILIRLLKLIDLLVVDSVFTHAYHALFTVALSLGDLVAVAFSLVGKLKTKKNEGKMSNALS